MIREGAIGRSSTSRHCGLDGPLCGRNRVASHEPGTRQIRYIFDVTMKDESLDQYDMYVKIMLEVGVVGVA
jgi:hypothetical protein